MSLSTRLGSIFIPRGVICREYVVVPISIDRWERRAYPVKYQVWDSKMRTHGEYNSVNDAIARAEELNTAYYTPTLTHILPFVPLTFFILFTIYITLT